MYPEFEGDKLLGLVNVDKLVQHERQTNFDRLRRVHNGSGDFSDLLIAPYQRVDQSRLVRHHEFAFHARRSAGSEIYNRTYTIPPYLQ